MPPEPDDARTPHGWPDPESDTEFEFDRTASLFPNAPQTPTGTTEEEGSSTQVLYERQPPASGPAPAAGAAGPHADIGFPLAGPEADLPTAPIVGKAGAGPGPGPDGGAPGSASAGSVIAGPEPTGRVLSLGDLPPAQWDRAMAIVQQFEDHWRTRGEPPLDEYLSLAGPLRGHVVVELILADLEFRRRHGQEARVEPYLTRYPELGIAGAADLIVRDYQARQRRDLVPSARAYPAEFAEFPALREELNRRFAALGADESVTRQPPRPSGGAGVTPGVPASARPGHPPEPANRPALPPEYRVIAKLGEGGMGQVWLVERAPFALRVVKVIHPNLAQFAESRIRMFREAMALDRIRHANAVVVHDVKETPVPYIEMEYIAGQSVDKLLTPKVPMPLPWIDRVLKQLCDVLQVAHEKWEIIHRDLKPSNLMLVHDEATGEDVLKVLDFGLAKFLNAEDSHASDHDLSITNAQQTLGTYLYMSPEQAMNSAEVQPSADIYSVGVILYEFLTGSRPFTGPTLASIAYQILNRPAPPFREKNPEVEVPEGIEELVLRCLDKDPAKRPASARDLAIAFHRLAQPPAPPLEPIAVAPPAPSLAPRLGWVLALALTGSALGVGGYRLIRGPDPAALPVHAAKPALAVPAGQAAVVEIVVPRTRARSVRVVPQGTPGSGIRVVAESGEETSTLRRFLVRTDPVKAKPGPHTLTFAATEGSASQTIRVALTVEPPQVVALPAGWVPVSPPALARVPSPYGSDASLVAVDGRLYHRGIERTLADGTRVLALLIAPVGPRGVQLGPFYMMQDKVWAGLFARFAREHPDPAAEPSSGGDPRLPVTNVTGLRAQAFAEWLGGRGHGFLPTLAQWDQAAGLHQVPAGDGPFRPDPNHPHGDWSGIAVGDRDDPLPVGTAGRDVSPYGCRDMAGNGLEWTRLPPNRADRFQVTLRSASFQDDKPYLFRTANDDDHREEFSRADPGIGFRVVIEVGPEP